MADWTDGYVADVEYTNRFYAELGPGLLQYLAISQGLRPAGLAEPFNYLDLGCGNGLTTLVLAAANPQGSFWGLDFNPVHVSNAQSAVRLADLGNVEFLEDSFADLEGLDLPDMDVVVLHGVWSWVDAANREAILGFLERRLAPGGLVYISYNALPGWAPLEPVRRLVWELAQEVPGASPQRMDAAVALIEELLRSPTGFFAHTPAAVRQVRELGAKNRNYLLHEYLNEGFQAYYHADVARELARAKLDYLGSAILFENHDELMVPTDAPDLSGRIASSALGQTLLDFHLDRSFRRDVFIRGRAACTRREHSGLLSAFRVARLQPGPLSTEIHHLDNKVTLPEQPVAALSEALGPEPRTLAELAGQPGLARFGVAGVAQVASILTCTGQLMIAPPAVGPSALASCARLNEVIGSGLLSDQRLDVLASPVLGTGVYLEPMEQLAIDLLRNGHEDLAPALRSVGVQRAGEDQGTVEDWVADFESGRLPLLRGLAVG